VRTCWSILVNRSYMKWSDKHVKTLARSMTKIVHKYETCMCTFVTITVQNEHTVRDGEAGHVAVCIKRHKHANKAADMIRPIGILLHNCVNHMEWQVLTLQDIIDSPSYQFHNVNRTHCTLQRQLCVGEKCTGGSLIWYGMCGFRSDEISGCAFLSYATCSPADTYYRVGRTGCLTLHERIWCSKFRTSW
jgi:hypothetical protein